MDVVEPETLTSALKVKDKEAGDVGKFLNRILGLSVQRQNSVSVDVWNYRVSVFSDYHVNSGSVVVVNTVTCAGVPILILMLV